MSEIANLFPETYETSQTRFRENLAVVQHFWPQAQLSQQRLSGDEDLTIDWIYSDARGKNEKVFILTIGEHGIEGYVGSAMQQRFIDRYLPRLNPETTGLLLVHAVNPWGMKYHCRVNANNVDLNRNFIYDGVFDPAVFYPKGICETSVRVISRIPPFAMCRSVEVGRPNGIPTPDGFDLIEI